MDVPSSSKTRGNGHNPVLIVFAGLPGTRKTTLARHIARERRAAFLRVDEIEQARRRPGEAEGYSRGGA